MTQQLTDEQAYVAARRLAPLAYDLAAALCVAFGDPPPPAWKDAPESDRKSTVDALFTAIVDPDRTPDQEHERWAAAKRDAGWGYGKVRDDEKRLHPLLVPYAKLPPEQKVRDVLFIELGAAVREGRLA